jgi:hypothetical protein
VGWREGLPGTEVTVADDLFALRAKLRSEARAGESRSEIVFGTVEDRIASAM